MKKIDILLGSIKVPLDFLLTVISVMAAYHLRIILAPYTVAIAEGTLPTFFEQLFFSFKAGALLIAIFALGKAYSFKATKKTSKEISKIFLLWIVWVMAIISYYYFIRNFPFSRITIALSWILTLFLAICLRILLKRFEQFLKKSLNIGKTRTLIFGNNKISEELIEILKKDPSYKIIGVIGGKNSNTRIVPIANKSQIKYILNKRRIDEIIITKSLSPEKSEELLFLCDLKHITYKFIPSLSDMRRASLEIDEINGIPIISLKATPLDGWGKIAKRILDISGALFGLTFLSPIMIATAIAIKLESKGPVLFTRLDNGSRVKRVGEKGHLFNFYKFRSMKDKTDTLRYTALANQNIRKEGPLVKIQNDPRITKVGKFIRKTSIDELPQLFSVLVGTMSLVGPRAHLPEEVAKYEDRHRFVLTIKPGVTGLPQVSGRSDLHFEDEIRLDRYYIENWSIWMDIKIIFKTFAVVFKPFKE
ncbi:MAG: sugar transferase [Candidatus Gracilibacteria bacterium]|jgi:exopolysaccharide biosynthesis polyprenyl glycosylphosphotransferase|nr:sugar transferase [Candidatus Gracilibacteria bacterium]